MAHQLRYEHPDTGRITDAAMVHKAGHEGGLHIDRFTGQIVTAIDDRPVWADGLVCALLVEHTVWWEARLNTYTLPELYDVGDLGWVAVDETGSEAEVDADAEYRMDRLAGILGANRETAEIDNALAEIELTLDNKRTPDEIAEMKDAFDLGFEPVGGRSTERRAG